MLSNLYYSLVLHVFYSGSLLFSVSPGSDFINELTKALYLAGFFMAVSVTPKKYS